MNRQNNDYQIYKEKIIFYDYWKVIVKRRKLVSGIVFVSVVLTAVINFLMPKVYRGEAIMAIKHTNIINPKEIIDIVGNKKEMIFTKNPGLVEKLKIVEVNGSNDKFKTIIDARNAERIQDCFPEFVEYIETLPSVKEQVKAEKENLKKQLDSLSVIVDMHNEFTRNYIKSIREGRFSMVTLNPADLTQKEYDLENQKENLQNALQNYDIISIDQTYIQKKPAKPAVMRNIILSAICSGVLAITAALLSEYAAKSNET